PENASREPPARVRRVRPLRYQAAELLSVGAADVLRGDGRSDEHRRNHESESVIHAANPRNTVPGRKALHATRSPTNREWDHGPAARVQAERASPRTTQRKPRWQVEVSMPCAMRAAGR